MAIDPRLVVGEGIPFANHVRYSVPPTADLVTIVADVSLANGAQTLALARPVVPCKFTMTITDADSSVTAGTVTFVGLNQAGETVTEVISIANGGTKTYATANAYASVTSITVAGLVGAAGIDHIKVGQSSALGLPVPSQATGFTVLRASVDNVGEAVGTVDATARTIIPTTLPNATHNYDFWFAWKMTQA